MKIEQDAEQPFQSGKDKFRWILTCGWKGLCPRCGKGKMFKSWLKVADTCDNCAQNYRFAAPDDGTAFFSLCIVAFPLAFFIVWIQVAFEPPWWVHLFTSLPFMVLGTLLPLRPIKGWPVASQFVNRAQEHAMQAIWSQLHGDSD